MARPCTNTQLDVGGQFIIFSSFATLDMEFLSLRKNNNTSILHILLKFKQTNKHTNQLLYMIDKKTCNNIEFNA